MRREGVRNGETLQKIGALLRQGEKVKDMAKKLGVSRQAIYAHMQNTQTASNKANPKEAVKGYKKSEKKYYIEWSVYNDALVKRGEFILFFDLLEEEKGLLLDMNEGKIGKHYMYSDALMDLCRVIKSGFGVDFRTMQGICNKLFPLFELQAPDYSTICKRFETLPSEIKKFIPSDKRELAIDGTGRSQSKRGYYRESKYETKSRTYVRVNIAVDVKTKEITAGVITSQKESEIPSVKKAVEESRKESEITTVYADRLHDSKEFRGELISKGTKPVIPARETITVEEAKKRCKAIEEQIVENPELKKDFTLLGQYQRMCTLVESVGDYEKWRDTSQYGKRSMVENFFSRDTLIFGDDVYSKKLLKAEKEMTARFTLLNLFMTLGKAKSKVELNSMATLLRERLTKDGGITMRRNR